MKQTLKNISATHTLGGENNVQLTFGDSPKLSIRKTNTF